MEKLEKERSEWMRQIEKLEKEQAESMNVISEHYYEEEHPEVKLIRGFLAILSAIKNSLFLEMDME